MGARVRRQVTFDFRDHRRLLKVLKILAVKQRTTQKTIVADALTAYLSQKQENPALLFAADKSFLEWHSEEDRVYDSL